MYVVYHELMEDVRNSDLREIEERYLSDIKRFSEFVSNNSVDFVAVM